MSIIGNAIMVGGGSSPTPTPSAVWKDVNFIDYDGSLLYSYTASEFASLTAMPANPSHDGLTSQGWNWSLSDAKTQVTTMGSCIIGQMYVTSDEKTKVHILLAKDTLSFYCGFGVNGTVVIDWGDNSSTNTVTGTSLSTVKNTQHTYAAVGEYTITLTVSSGSMSFFGTSTYGSHIIKRTTSTALANNRAYHSMVQWVRLGKSCTLGNYAFYGCYSLSSITIPSTVSAIGTYAFQQCYALSGFVIPTNVTSLGTYDFHSCYNLQLISIPLKTVTLGARCFYGCAGLSRISLSKNMTSFTTYIFYNCYSLNEIVIPPNLTTIANYSFYQCYGLTSIIIPSAVTTIGTYAFQTCTGLQRIRFVPTSPPTVSGTTTFTSLPTTCVIEVPTNSLTSYEGATNYPDSESYTYVGY